MERKKRNWIIAGVAVVAFGGVLSLFQDDNDKAEADAKPKTTTAPAKPADKPSEAASKPSDTPSPDAAQREALIRALRTIEPGLVAKEDRAVNRARNMCSDIKSGMDDAKVKSLAKARYEGGTVPSLTDDQAANIVTAVRSSFCS
ncbi:DUF732 domain-containing protein [Streptomyces sp. NPDC048696]|uniref:DUF732 domain-containing protein n=1 Tax=Streptomyces sp. NPDC048696 TaxID=3365585 RepID=UPI0037162E3C